MSHLVVGLLLDELLLLSGALAFGASPSLLLYSGRAALGDFRAVAAVLAGDDEEEFAGSGLLEAVDDDDLLSSITWSPSHCSRVFSDKPCVRETACQLLNPVGGRQASSI